VKEKITNGNCLQLLNSSALLVGPGLAITLAPEFVYSHGNL